MQSMKHYFVTGATGVVGSALVPFVLEDPASSVSLLIRADSDEHLGNRIDQLFDYWEFDKHDSNLRSRIFPLRGDVKSQNFGLSDDEYRHLTERCTHIVHSAGDVRMNRAIEEARSSAIGSAENIVVLARNCMSKGNLEKIELVSTVGVGGRMTHVPEQWLSNKRAFHNTYEQAKAEAEDYIKAQMDEYALPLTIHRPSMVVGDTKSGKIMHFQIFYYLCEFLSGKQTQGLLPYLEGVTLDTIPVDYVARAIHFSSLSQQTIAKVFQLCSGPKYAMQINWLVQELNRILLAQGEQLPDLKIVPLAEFNETLDALAAKGSEKAARSIRNTKLYFDYAGTSQVFDNVETDALLSTKEISLPAPASYLDLVIESYLRHKQIS